MAILANWDKRYKYVETKFDSCETRINFVIAIWSFLVKNQR